MEVRPATDADAAATGAVHRAAVLALADHYSEEQRTSWAAPAGGEGDDGATEDDGSAEADDRVTFVAERDWRVVGFAALDPGEAAVCAVFVHPAHQRRGVGRALLERVEEAARERDPAVLTLHASVNAEGFYAAAGYDPVERTTVSPSGGADLECVVTRTAVEA